MEIIFSRDSYHQMPPDCFGCTYFSEKEGKIVSYILIDNIARKMEEIIPSPIRLRAEPHESFLRDLLIYWIGEVTVHELVHELGDIHNESYLGTTTDAMMEIAVKNFIFGDNITNSTLEKFFRKFSRLHSFLRQKLSFKYLKQ